MIHYSVEDQLTKLEREQKRIANRIPKYEAKRLAGANITVEERTRLEMIQEKERAEREELDRLLLLVAEKSENLNTLQEEKERFFEKGDGLTVHEKANYHKNVESYQENQFKITSLRNMKVAN
ncbi:hypothetical protein [Rossellomorea marisflavi]|uniref:hypothetical protein n=1 Tax=Rossellomorea marisflavi TaxID=189381 RepID=UPI003F9F68BE